MPVTLATIFGRDPAGSVTVRDLPAVRPSTRTRVSKICNDGCARDHREVRDRQALTPARRECFARGLAKAVSTTPRPGLCDGGFSSTALGNEGGSSNAWRCALRARVMDLDLPARSSTSIRRAWHRRLGLASSRADARGLWCLQPDDLGPRPRAPYRAVRSTSWRRSPVSSQRLARRVFRDTSYSRAGLRHPSRPDRRLRARLQAVYARPRRNLDGRKHRFITASILAKKLARRASTA